MLRSKIPYHLRRSTFPGSVAYIRADERMMLSALDQYTYPNCLDTYQLFSNLDLHGFLSDHGVHELQNSVDQCVKFCNKVQDQTDDKLDKTRKAVRSNLDFLIVTIYQVLTTNIKSYDLHELYVRSITVTSLSLISNLSNHDQSDVPRRLYPGSWSFTINKDQGWGGTRIKHPGWYVCTQSDVPSCVLDPVPAPVLIFFMS